jgi:hypothetical protein
MIHLITEPIFRLIQPLTWHAADEAVDVMRYDDDARRCRASDAADLHMLRDGAPQCPP